MNAMATNDWHEANRRYLMARLAMVREFMMQMSSRDEESSAHSDRFKTIEQEIQESSVATQGEAALDQLCAAFELSKFERDVLLLCAGIELDPDFAHLCAAAQGDSQLAYPTFKLALAALPEAHWTALIPAAPLRHWRMIELGAADTITGAQLRIDERVLHYLVGITYIDERLQTYFEIVGSSTILPSSYRAHAERIVQIWSQQDIKRPVIHLCGDAGSGKRTLAATACGALGLKLYSIQASNIPASSTERESLIRLWQREAVLSRCALLIESDEGDDPACVRSAQQFVNRVDGLLFVTSSAIVSAKGQSVSQIEINRPAADEQRALWEIDCAWPCR